MTVWLAHRALVSMVRQGTEFSPLETGGILLGWRRGDDRVVVDVVGPGQNALHGRTRFLPDHKWQMNELSRVFKATGGDIDYLGDWHTHPDGHAIMSQADIHTLTRISRRVRGALMLIVAGPDFSSPDVGCWKSGSRKGLFTRDVAIEPQDLQLFEPPQDWPNAHGDAGTDLSGLQ